MTASSTEPPAGPSQADEPDDQALVRLVQTLPRDSEEHDAACEQLITRYQSLVRSCAQRYWQSPESQEELMQVGYVGLLKDQQLRPGHRGEPLRLRPAVHQRRDQAALP